MGKRLISLLLAVVLVLSLAGLTTAFAETTVTDETEDTATQTASADDSSSGSENANNTDSTDKSAGSTGLTSTASVISDNNTNAETETALSADEVQALIDALPTVEELSAMTTEEQLEVYYATQEANDAYYALSAEDQALVDDSVLDALFAYFNSLTEEIPGGQGGGDQGGDTTSSTISVYYDTITVNSSSITALNSSTGISTVTISGGSATESGSVTQADGTANSWSATTTAITRTSDSSEIVTLTITPEEGYYVTYVTICCTTGGQKPTDCSTWNAGDAFSGSYSIEQAGSISINVPLNGTAGFHHNDSTDPYFILIAVAKIPSPLYVEYDYGDIVSYIETYNAENSTNLSTSVFTGSADTWTDTYNGNIYGTTDSGVTNGVMTDDTQYKYTYATGSDSNAAGWKHYANSITQDAIDAAAAAGYYFAGWEATYYTTCTETANESGSYNNYTYSFSGTYGSTTDYYQPGASVTLTVHVKLVAIWVKPTVTTGSLTITKSFGDDSVLDADDVESITFTVTKNGDSAFGTQTVTLSNSNSWTQTITGLNAGTYTVAETSYAVEGYNCTTTVSVNNGEATSATSASAVLSGTLDSTYNSSTGQNEYKLTVGTATVAFTNTYAPSNKTITITKDVTGNMGDTTKDFDFTLTLKDASGTAYMETLTITRTDDATATSLAYNTTDGAYSFQLSDDDKIVITVPYGYSYTVTEADYKTSDGYTTTTSGSATSGTTTSDVTIAYTNDKTVTPDTGITLDALPFVLILTASLSGLGLVLINKKRRDSDG